MENRRYNLAVNPAKPLSIDLTNGNIKIISHKGKSMAEIEFTPFGTMVPELKFEEKDQNRIHFLNSEMIEVNVVIYIPDELNDLEVVLNKGNLAVMPGNGTYDLQVYNGGIKVDSFSGNLKCNSLNGEIKIESCDGQVNINSTNGPVKIMNWKCRGGRIESNSGQVLVSIVDLKKDLEIQAKNGTLILGIDPGLQSTIIARGTDVLDYREKIHGDSLGSPAKIETNGGGYQVTLFSRTNKAKVSTIDQLDHVAPDFEKWFDDLEDEIRQSLDFKKFMKDMQDLGQKMESMGRRLARNFHKAFNQKNEKDEKSPEKSSDSGSGARMEILKMLNEGKISAEEAEKLLRAL
jgi:hypothetical protein